MSPLHTAFLVFCLTGFSACEIASPQRVARDRVTSSGFQYRYQRGNATNPRQSADYPNYYRRQPIYRFDYSQANHRRTDQGSGNWQPHRYHDRNGVQPYTTGIYKTYGRGVATVPRMGGTVTVANEIPHPKVNKGTITARVIDPSVGYNEVAASLVHRKRRQCMGCPQNRAVMASKGNSHVILPEPCPTLRWVSLVGPQPGTKIPEGVHSLIGRLGNRGKICQYQYEVVVRRCGGIKVKNAKVNCTADDAWGSTCTVTCEGGHELTGSGNLQCQDDLKWSHPMPTCNRKVMCPLPQTPDDSKMWCQVPDETELIGDTLPPNTYCRFKVDGKQRVISCIDGYWVIRHLRGRRYKNGKHRHFGTTLADDQRWRNSVPGDWDRNSGNAWR